MCSESFPKEFEKTTEVLPYTKYGLTTANDFKEEEEKLKHLEWLKKAGLTEDELKLYQENESQLLNNRQIESSVLKRKLEVINDKIFKLKTKENSLDDLNAVPSTSKSGDCIENLIKESGPHKLYPDGHPMNSIKELEENLFEHLNGDIIPITKRRKLLRRLERKKEKVLAEEKQLFVPLVDKAVDPIGHQSISNAKSLWDVREVPKPKENKVIGPKAQTMYTVKDSKIVRLEPVPNEPEEFQAVDIVVPINEAEETLLEGTKMSVDDIRKIDRFKDYEPGIPSKVLYLKNIAAAVSQEQISLLFNQFVLDNGGPIDVRLMTGRMRGQAFVAFEDENVAIQALEEINGTILSGKPIIAEFGRNSNRIQDEDR